ncbi:hypothetical protein DFH09DRAFT_1293959 [Mycena vulgaris]|nr:hypothetical protein DFH09DRAFT_1293959 [Mycena vulgaris]
MATSFPQELIDLVVDELHTDISSLRACSLSFRAMVASARIHLFSIVVLGPPAAPSGSGIKKHSDCQKFSKLLESAPHLAALVKDLRIVDDDPLFKSWMLNGGRALAALLPLFDLTRISVQCRPMSLDWDHMHRTLKVAFLDVLSSPHIQSVSLHGIIISAPPECPLFHLFKNTRAVTHISLSYHLRANAGRSPIIPPVWKPKLQSLFIGTNDFVNLLPALSSSALDYSQLRDLTLTGFSESEVNEVLIALKERNVVEELTVIYPVDNDVGAGLHGIQFLTSLHTVRFRTHCTLVHEELAATVRYCALNASLDTITLEVWVHNAAYCLESDWTALAIAAKEGKKPVEVLLGEFGKADVRPRRLAICAEACLARAEEALAIPSSGLTLHVV